MRSSFKTGTGQSGNVLTAIAALMVGLIPATAQQDSRHLDSVIVQGAVLSSDGKPVGDAVVRLELKGAPIETKTDAGGTFTFSNLQPGSYLLNAEKSGLRSRDATVNASPRGDIPKIDLVLEDPGSSHPDSPSSIQTMTFADTPNFTVAGVTDWTAVGGHGSDSSLRVSEALAGEILMLKPPGTGSSATGASGNIDEAARHRLAGEFDERSGDSLAAVHEYEQAVNLDPSEQNYFEWGSELLLHRAVLQAQVVFNKGAEAHPRSVRMLTGLGAALFAGARYDEAALRLCNASDFNPTDPGPYIFMGKIEISAPNTLACVEQKLARFVQEQPENSLAN